MSGKLQSSTAFTPGNNPQYQLQRRLALRDSLTFWMQLKIELYINFICAQDDRLSCRTDKTLRRRALFLIYKSRRFWPWIVQQEIATSVLQYIHSSTSLVFSQYQIRYLFCPFNPIRGNLTTSAYTRNSCKVNFFDANIKYNFLKTNYSYLCQSMINKASLMIVYINIHSSAVFPQT